MPKRLAGAEGTGTLRVLRILRQLQRRPQTVKQLAAANSTSEKTIRRDILTIQKAGFRVFMRAEEYGRRVFRILQRTAVSKTYTALSNNNRRGQYDADLRAASKIRKR